MEKLYLALKALGHPERLRIVALLSHGELTISELVQVLGLSQPRITQYVKTLEAAAILVRLKEGSWVYSRIQKNDPDLTALITTALAALPDDDLLLNSDLRRLESVRSERAAKAQEFFANVAKNNGQLGDEYLPHKKIETAMLDMIGHGPFNYMIDLGTGTGRILELFSDRIKRGSGIDNNSDMLNVARHKLGETGRNHISVRHSDLSSSPLETGIADLVTLHQVLHYLDDPLEAIQESARLLEPNGKLLVVDFDTHTNDEFRDLYAHRRLGISDDDISFWFQAAGLKSVQQKSIQTKSDAPNVKLWTAKNKAQKIK